MHENYSKTACNETCPDRVRKHLSEHENPKMYKLYYLVINHSFLTIDKAEQDKEGKDGKGWRNMETWCLSQKHEEMHFW